MRWWLWPCQVQHLCPGSSIDESGLNKNPYLDSLHAQVVSEMRILFTFYDSKITPGFKGGHPMQWPLPAKIELTLTSLTFLSKYLYRWWFPLVVHIRVGWWISKVGENEVKWKLLGIETAVVKGFFLLQNYINPL